jgi:plasmid stabilization system protein ParE
MKPLHYHQLAESEIDGAHNWYMLQSQQAADGFYEELIPALNRIATQPRLYSPYMHGTQRIVLSRYPYSIVYRERLHEIQIVAIAHAKRRPGYWTKRLRQ